VPRPEPGHVRPGGNDGTGNGTDGTGHGSGNAHRPRDATGRPGSVANRRNRAGGRHPNSLRAPEIPSLPRHPLGAPRRADSRVAAIFIILGLGAFSIFGLILAATMLIGVRRAAVTGATKPSPEAARPLSNRYSGLICYCPPDATAVTAIDIAALAA